MYKKYYNRPFYIDFPPLVVVIYAQIFNNFEGSMHLSFSGRPSGCYSLGKNKLYLIRPELGPQAVSHNIS